MLRLLVWLGVGVIAVWAPNLLWFYRSTLHVENLGKARLERVTAFACEETIELGDLAPGASSFALLPECGETTLSVSSRDRRGEVQVCSAYVESAMTHVDAWFDSPRDGDCTYGEPPFSPLLVGLLF